MQMLYVRSLMEGERQQLIDGSKSSHDFTRRRCRTLLASAAGRSIPEIAGVYGCNRTTVREAIHAFNRRGTACLRERRWQRREPCAIVDASQGQRVRLLQQSSPADFGKRKKSWSLTLLAEVCCEQGLAAREISREGMRQAIQRLGIPWKQAKSWAQSPKLS